MQKLELFVNGTPYPFYQADLSYSVEQLAHTFSCKIPPMNIRSALPVEFRLNDTLILSGQIDQVDSATATRSHDITITGRSKSANMIDSRITMDALYEQNVEKLLRSLARPFGLNVISRVTSMPLIPEFQINAESPVENVAQIIREQGLMLIERNGTLTIENTAHATLQGIGLSVGENVESLDISRTFNKRFHHVEVQGAWDDANAVITQPAINPARTMVIICDQLQSAEACLSRATYERDLSIARSLNVSTTIADVFQVLAIDGLNRVIQVKDADQHFNEMLVIKALSLSVSESSASTHIELCRPFREQSHA
ncbi:MULTISPECIES: phage tail protein [unclassified Vibrio]|uniref:phage tail protein n=1 Tax=unclassified Vibrio TaxID=2614977 RepID=UPI00136154D8|nr:MULTISPECIES: phage tail protein [unclassified Vibrio]NAW58750.1 phage tail protein [Vibrio sp. V36_P2S2PM302]NAX27183.1 phage tail protein [Vibrio sp. V38_P2S17PM301]NAX32185.1 phage tail protein [Vibrio sp. V37_P2S8PM304]